jgi:hypothetical protein
MGPPKDIYGKFILMGQAKREKSWRIDPMSAG